jgi:DNA-binding transcriptional regulator YiaG
MKFERKGAGVSITVKELVDQHEFSKYQIARLVEVSWNTVSFWYKGVFQPNEEHQKKLDSLKIGKKKRKDKDHGNHCLQ